MDLASLTPDERQRWEELSPEQRRFVAEREPLWRRAHAIAAQDPHVDPSDVYHALVTWHETPTERLRRALNRARLFARTR